jgi:hypothetical protein
MDKMKLKQIIREEVRTALNEAKYKIELSAVNEYRGSVILTIGNDAADLYGFKLPKDQLANLKSIMETQLDATLIKAPIGGMFNEGEIHFEATGPVFISDIMKAAAAIKGLNLTLKY